MPDYYFWEKDKTSILILVSGFYEITACVFGRGAPNLQINGESIHSKSDENMNTQNMGMKENKRVFKKKKERDMVGSKI